MRLQYHVTWRWCGVAFSLSVRSGRVRSPTHQHNISLQLRKIHTTPTPNCQESSECGNFNRNTARDHVNMSTEGAFEETQMDEGGATGPGAPTPLSALEVRQPLAPSMCFLEV